MYQHQSCSEQQIWFIFLTHTPSAGGDGPKSVQNVLNWVFVFPLKIPVKWELVFLSNDPTKRLSWRGKFLTQLLILFLLSKKAAKLSLWVK